MSPDELVDRIHAAGRMGVMAVTGGGTGAISELLHRGGGSATLLEAVVPYSEEALQQFLHTRPEKYCDALTARRMAMAAYRRACELRPGGFPFGVGVTASLAKEGERIGRSHRAFVAWQTADRTEVRSLTLHPHSRVEEERRTSLAVLDAVARACGAEGAVTGPETFAADQTAGRDARPEWREVLHTPVRWWRSRPGEPARALLPGSFNPVHDGHIGMAQAAERRLGAPVDLVLSITNADKPPLDYIEIGERLAGIEAVGLPVVLVNGPLFIDQARLLPGRTFVVGADTWERLVDPKYYGGLDGLHRTFDLFAECGTRFLVFGRCVGGRFHGPADLPLPDHPFVRQCVQCAGEEEFRRDISSTELRRRMSGEHRD